MAAPGGAAARGGARRGAGAGRGAARGTRARCTRGRGASARMTSWAPACAPTDTPRKEAAPLLVPPADTKLDK